MYGKAKDEHFFLSPAACILTVQQMPDLKFKLICSSVHEGGKGSCFHSFSSTFVYLNNVILVHFQPFLAVMALRGYVEIENR